MIVQPNQYPIRTILKSEDPAVLERARKEREAHLKRLWRMRNKERARVYWRAWKQRNRDTENERKRRWRKENRDHVRAYERRYYELNPELKVYRAQKNREYRARVRK